MLSDPQISKRILTTLFAMLNDDLGNADYRKPFETCTATLCRRSAETETASAICLAALPKATFHGRPSLLRILGILAEKEGLAAISQGAASTDEAIRNAAVRALASWPDMSAWGTLLVELPHVVAQRQRHV